MPTWKCDDLNKQILSNAIDTGFPGQTMDERLIRILTDQKTAEDSKYTDFSKLVSTMAEPGGSSASDNEVDKVIFTLLLNISDKRIPIQPLIVHDLWKDNKGRTSLYRDLLCNNEKFLEHHANIGEELGSSKKQPLDALKELENMLEAKKGKNREALIMPDGMENNIREGNTYDLLSVPVISKPSIHPDILSCPVIASETQLLFKKVINETLAEKKTLEIKVAIWSTNPSLKSSRPKEKAEAEQKKEEAIKNLKDFKERTKAPLIEHIGTHVLKQYLGISNCPSGEQKPGEPGVPLYFVLSVPNTDMGHASLLIWNNGRFYGLGGLTPRTEYSPYLKNERRKMIDMKPDYSTGGGIVGFGQWVLNQFPQSVHGLEDTSRLRKRFMKFTVCCPDVRYVCPNLLGKTFTDNHKNPISTNGFNQYTIEAMGLLQEHHIVGLKKIICGDYKDYPPPMYTEHSINLLLHRATKKWHLFSNNFTMPYPYSIFVTKVLKPSWYTEGPKRYLLRYPKNCIALLEEIFPDLHSSNSLLGVNPFKSFFKADYTAAENWARRSRKILTMKLLIDNWQIMYKKCIEEHARHGPNKLWSPLFKLPQVPNLAHLSSNEGYFSKPPSDSATKFINEIVSLLLIESQIMGNIDRQEYGSSGRKGPPDGDKPPEFYENLSREEMRNAKPPNERIFVIHADDKIGRLDDSGKKQLFNYETNEIL